jgi:hypothetical protein
LRAWLPCAGGVSPQGYPIPSMEVLDPRRATAGWQPVPSWSFPGAAKDQCTVATRYLSGRRPVHHSHQVLWSFYRRSGTSAPSPQGIYPAEDRSAPFPPGTLVYLQTVKDHCTVATRYTVLIWLETSAPFPPGTYFGLSTDGQGPVHQSHKVHTLVYLQMVRDQCTVATRYFSGRRPVQ